MHLSAAVPFLTAALHSSWVDRPSFQLLVQFLDLDQPPPPLASCAQEALQPTSRHTSVDEMNFTGPSAPYFLHFLLSEIHLHGKDGGITYVCILPSEMALSRALGFPLVHACP